MTPVESGIHYEVVPYAGGIGFSINCETTSACGIRLKQQYHGFYSEEDALNYLRNTLIPKIKAGKDGYSER